MFVNNRGRVDTYIPADMQMKCILKEQKKHIKHMYSNKLEDDVVSEKSKAIHGLNRIADKFDDMTKVIVRATAPKTLSSVKDEQIMIEDSWQIPPAYA